MSLPKMSAAASFYSPFGESSSRQEGEGLELAVYALGTWRQRDCQELPGQRNCGNVGCGEGDTAGAARLNAIRNLRARGAVAAGHGEGRIVEEREWDRHCRDVYVRNTLDTLF